MNRNKKNINILVDEGFSDAYLTFIKGIVEVNKIYHFDKVLKEGTDEPVDLVIFTGGEDVNPEYYGEKTGKYTYINKERDSLAYDIFNRYLFTPKLGICRGSQALCVFNGGKLIQHVTGHTNTHLCHLNNNYNEFIEFEISSTHHQMMYPFNLNNDNYELIAWSKKYMSDTYLNGNDEEISLHTKFLEPEIVYFKKFKSLAIQGHPEFNNVSVETKIITYNLINQYLLNNK